MIEQSKYQYSRAYHKILDLITSNPQEDVFVIRGGQGASKTVSILQLIIQTLIQKEREATVLSSELSKMKKTVIRDYSKICKDWGVIKDTKEFNRSESKHEYKNGSYIDFIGADLNDVGKGFRRDLLYINEADKMNLDKAVQFISRANLTIIDYNPDKRFWGDDYVNDNNFLTLTFEDNQFLPESEVRSILDYKTKGFYNPNLPYPIIFDQSNIKNRYWSNKWRVYGLGLIGSLEGLVIPEHEVIDNIPAGAELLGYGTDFGKGGADPTTTVAFYYYDGAIIWDEIVYQSRLRDSEHIDLLKKAGVNSNLYNYCDNSEPSKIKELQIGGFKNSKGLKKETIDYGVNLINERPLKVSRRSKHIIEELGSYIYGDNGKPIDDFNHTIDAARYFYVGKFGVLNQKPAISRVYSC